MNQLKRLIDKTKDLSPRSQQAVAVCMMIAAGAVSIGVSEWYVPKVPAISVQETSEPAAQKEVEEETAAERETEEETFIPAADKFNLAFLFEDGADVSNPMDSLGGRIYKELSAMEADWLGNIYNYTGMTPEEAARHLGRSRESVMGKYNRNDEKQKKSDPSTWTIHSWKKINMAIYDGDGKKLSGDSNLKDILSMISVYTFYHDYEDHHAFLEHARQLWNDSHTYTVSMGNVYYCDGCLDEDEEYEEFDLDTLMKGIAAEATGALAPETASAEPPPESGAQAETLAETAAETTAEDSLNSEIVAASVATPAEAAMGPGVLLSAETGEAEGTKDAAENQTEPSDESEGAKEEEEISCPGHIDLNITIRITGMDERKSLFSLDQKGNTEDEFWSGWSDDMRNYARLLRDQDWFENYGISISNIAPGQSISAEEISAYMAQLPDGISQTRRDLVRFALESVGKVPYYWGGKPSARGYTGNLFGSIVEPDKKGRIRKGLDCSGWISWVYWSVTGNHLPSESTAGLVNCGTAVAPKDLQPGDILIRRGEEAM
ncbi:NlpC/P60 family protein [Clostridium sp. AM58-1XD]|uniref:NlpC/P60 family protein n=1 Tax=Clostridium sp. AM58-1XD TaxID=2292307 RepID=UPI0015F71133|nr:NlpC/P60 family protein [Clostridium sp. AM58-1XD]